MRDHTEPLFTRFPREYSLRRLIVRSKEDFNEAVAARLHCEGGCFTSLYDTSLVIDKVFWDLDSKDVQKAREDALRLVSRLKDVDVEPIIVFSGRKGYHVYVLVDPWIPPNVVTAKEVLRGIQLRFAHDLQTFDKHVLGDVRRMVRIPGTEHPNGTMCTFVSVDGSVIPPPSYVKRVRIHDLYDPNVIPIERSASSPMPVFDVTSLPQDKRAAYEYLRRIVRPCVAEVVAFDPEPPHDVRVDLVSELMHLGYTVDEVVKIIEKLGWSDYDERVTRYQVEQIYRGGYKPLSCSRLKFFVRCTECGWRYWW